MPLLQGGYGGWHNVLEPGKPIPAVETALSPPPHPLIGVQHRAEGVQQGLWAQGLLLANINFY